MRKLLNYLTVLSLAFFILLSILAVPSFFVPSFLLKNMTSERVNVTVYWREESKHIGYMKPGESKEFVIDDEAAVVFKAQSADGRRLESEPLYFTRGIRVNVRITENEIKVEYDSNRWY